MVHFAMAALVISLLSKKIAKLKDTKHNKYVKEKVTELESQKTIVLLVPIIGPIMGYGLVKAIVPGIPERGYRANNPGETDSSSDGG